jgi:hypothetical protein
MLVPTRPAPHDPKDPVNGAAARPSSSRNVLTVPVMRTLPRWAAPDGLGRPCHVQRPSSAHDDRESFSTAQQRRGPS